MKKGKRMSAQPVNETRPIKRSRRSREQIATVRDALFDALQAENPMTVRQCFYRLVSAGVIDKTEAEYKSTVCRLLGRMRRDRVIPFGWIADSTRWMRKPDTYPSLEAALEYTAQCYRRSMWNDQDSYVEVWLEKDALAGVLYQETEQWDVPLMVTRGYPSLSYLYEAAEAIAAKDKPAHLYYFGDYDPSGVDITRAVEAGIREFAPEAEIYFERVAVTKEQIEVWGLPTRPTKKTDSRSKAFGDESIEVDAIPPARLREIARECITRHVDFDLLSRLEIVEEAERETLLRISQAWQSQ